MPPPISWYSRLLKAVEGAKITKAPASQWLSYFEKQGGFTKEEFDRVLRPFLQKNLTQEAADARGVAGFHGPQESRTLTKADVLDAAKKNALDVRETRYGDEGPGERPAFRAARQAQARFELLAEQLENDLAGLQNRPHFALDKIYQEAAGVRSVVQKTPKELVEEIGLPATFEPYIKELYARRKEWDVAEAAVSKVKTASAKYPTQTLPGGSDYREIVLGVPNKKASERLKLFTTDAEGSGDFHRYRVLNSEGRVINSFPRVEDARRQADQLNDAAIRSHDPPTFTSSHFPDVENPVVHVRMKNRIDRDGNPMTFLEEVQSDAHQTNKQTGLPFKRQEDWMGLGVRRAIMDAVEQGHGRFGWTTGAQQADRYDLRKVVDRVVWNEKNGVLTAYQGGGPRVFRRENVTADDLPEIIGREAADKLLMSRRASGTPIHEIAGEQLAVGGQGKSIIYDKIMPNVIKDTFKKLGLPEPKIERARVQLPEGARSRTQDLPYDDEVWSVELPPALHEKVKSGGMPLYSLGGAALLPAMLNEQRYDEAGKPVGKPVEHKAGAAFVPTLPGAMPRDATTARGQEAPTAPTLPPPPEMRAPYRRQRMLTSEQEAAGLEAGKLAERERQFDTAVKAVGGAVTGGDVFGTFVDKLKKGEAPNAEDLLGALLTISPAFFGAKIAKATRATEEMGRVVGHIAPKERSVESIADALRAAMAPSEEQVIRLDAHGNRVIGPESAYAGLDQPNIGQEAQDLFFERVGASGPDDWARKNPGRPWWKEPGYEQAAKDVLATYEKGTLKFPERRAPDAATLASRHAEQGGMTINPFTGVSPTEGIAVSPYKQFEVALDHAPTADEITAFTVMNKKMLDQPEHFLGTWFDKASGKHYLDVSVVTPDLRKAMDLGIVAKQKALWDIGAGKEIPVEDVLSGPGFGRPMSEYDMPPPPIPDVPPGGMTGPGFGRPSAEYDLPPADWDPHAVAQQIITPSPVSKKLPTAEQFAQSALAGIEQRGWYENSAKALSEAFGPDAPRFAALLAATSPRQTVKDNLRMSLRAWGVWEQAGRPTDPKAVEALMKKANLGTRSRYPNAVRALTSDDVTSPGLLSGLKVDSFHGNLIGDVNRVTLDTWMAKLARMNPASLGKESVYGPYADRVRETAELLTKTSGRAWTPAQVQSANWGWAKALTEAGGGKQLNVFGKSPLAAPVGLSDVNDFASLLQHPQFRMLTEKMGLPPVSTRPAGIMPVPVDEEALRVFAKNMALAKKGKYALGIGAGVGLSGRPGNQPRPTY